MEFAVAAADRTCYRLEDESAKGSGKAESGQTELKVTELNNNSKACMHADALLVDGIGNETKLTTFDPRRATEDDLLCLFVLYVAICSRAERKDGALVARYSP